ncbi:hypothetical protein BJ912DRAFT_931864 [Pholiota molesta]|nr:hypothetical protein BJ912DRAFT_931864 [Pholiota molesta]
MPPNSQTLQVQWMQRGAGAGASLTVRRGRHLGYVRSPSSSSTAKAHALAFIGNVVWGSMTNSGAQPPLAASRALLMHERVGYGRTGQDLKIITMGENILYMRPRVVGSPLSFTSYIPIRSIQDSGELTWHAPGMGWFHIRGGSSFALGVQGTHKKKWSQMLKQDMPNNEPRRELELFGKPGRTFAELGIQQSSGKAHPAHAIDKRGP